MSIQWKGSILSSVEPTTSTSAAVGVWNLSDQLQAQSASLWPALIVFPPSVEYLVVAGGGGGSGSGSASARTAGAGAGGFRTATGFAVSSGNTYTVTVGAGGAGSSSYLAIPGKGNNSVFSTINSTGGGWASNDGDNDSCRWSPCDFY